MVISIFACLALACSQKLSRRVPINYILLFTYTFCMGFMVSFICGMTAITGTCHYNWGGSYSCVTKYGNSYIVVAAAGLTAAMVLGLTVYAMTTKTDFTYFGGFLWMALFSLIFMGMFMGIFSYDPQSYNIMNILYCTLGVIIFGFYLIWDT
jgi:FtsH-binding integral membrane protein